MHSYTLIKIKLVYVIEIVKLNVSAISKDQLLFFLWKRLTPV